MTRAGLRERLRSRRVQAILAAVVVLVASGIALAVTRSGSNITTRAQFVAGTPENGKPVRLDTTLYLPEHTPAPAVLLAQGFGGDKSGLDGTARTLADHGYVVLAYTARGFGRSGGLIHFDSPRYEVRDAERLVTYLTEQPQVEPDKIAVAGSSYGGGLALLLAGTDRRIKAVGADITWNNLAHALFPNAAGSDPGVFKKLWAGELFGNAFATGLEGLGGSTNCGRFAPDVCAAYQYAARTGHPNGEMRRLMRAASPATVLDRITAPTLLTQGEQDSLFPLSEADANARGIAANGTPVRVVWRPGGHDDPSAGAGVVTDELLNWFGAAFDGKIGRSQPFQYAQLGASVSSQTGQIRAQTMLADGYPGIDGTPRRRSDVRLDGPAQHITAPAGGTPATVTAVPGLGGILGQLGGLGAAAGGLSIPTAFGQTAYFTSARLTHPVSLVGSPTVRLRITSRTAHDVTLFAAVRDVSADGTDTLPQQLVAPLRLSGMRPGAARTVTVHLPSVVRTVPAGYRLVLTVATTDFAYQLPQDARSYTVALAPGSRKVVVPTVHGRAVRTGHPIGWLITAAAVIVAAMLAVALVIRRRRRVVHRAPELTDVPVSISNLVKEYAGGYRAVDDVSFRVERGQVVGLLGPNGAGKTTTLRVLVGLITPTAGTVHVFGEPITPGASVLARLGTFIEGPGFLPHLSGRENLRLFWAASGRPPDDAHVETALDIAGLGPSVDRRVRTYSHGMKQRLGIAQAMLGLPELLVLDEPTNGLDPPQIAEMREVLRRYADTGRTVVVSSHLLAEVEQTCTHVVVMHKGRLVKAGAVGDIAGPDGVQLAVDDPTRAAKVLADAGIAASLVPTRRALEDVFLDLIGGD